MVAVLLAILLVAGLVTGVLFATTEETRTGSATIERQVALNLAESAIEETIAGFAASLLLPFEVGETRRQAARAGVPVAVFITRLDSTQYWVVAGAGDASNQHGIARRIGVLVTVSMGANRSITIDRVTERAWSELF